MSKNNNTTCLIETAIFAALAMALSMIPDFASWFTPSFGAIPLILFALRRGTKYGLFAGLIWGLLHFVLSKVYYLSLSQVFIEYILAFISMGLAGVFSAKFKDALSSSSKTKALSLSLSGAILATFVRYVWHYIAGVIFWASYAPKGMSATLYSLSVNGTAGLLTLFFVVISIIILVISYPSFFLPKK